MLLITADIHGSTEALKEIVDIAASRKVEQVLIAGDLCPREEPVFASLLSRLPGLVLVRGNSDASYQFAQARIHLPPLVRTLSYQGLPITLTHGHVDVPYTVGGIVISGHTHIPHLKKDADGTLWLNPGSPSRPRSSSGATYALIDTEGVGIHRLKTHSPFLYHRFKSS
ncbi:MAG: metallophosphoesterase family protein [Spirochaetales bacterium]|jgi:putative phosphoesterase|nr:metallophosphoesterase family protein [Spirochaetales bacterium]